MVLQTCQALYAEFLQELELHSATAEKDSERFALLVRTTRDYLQQLRKLVVEEGFSDTKDEIEFFKRIKPKFIQPLIRERARYQLTLNLPKGTRETILAYYEAELKQLADYFNRYRFEYDYYRQQMTNLDYLYFVRYAEISSPNHYGMPVVDPEFSTTLDFLFAEFSAYEQVQDIILNHITELTGPITSKSVEPRTPETNYGLSWTGESINLVELAYGIWLTGQFNHGNATVSDIVRWLEGSLDIRIGRAYRRWTEISRRDRLHATKYIDRMREVIFARLENEDDVQRRKRQARK